MFSGLLVFFLQVVILVIAILVTLLGILALVAKGKVEGKTKLKVISLNKKFTQYKECVEEEVLDKQAKKLKKAEVKATKKEKKKEKNATKALPRLFVLNFNGDIKASQVTALREEVTALLTLATKEDQVLVCVESGGGVVHGYGLAASQLLRIKARGIPLIIAVDKVAASGGYMMACVADKIIASPFAIIGSIGAVIQLPNFNRFLKKHAIDYEQLTAGEFKRTLSVFGENTKEGRDKVQEELEDLHELFKEFVNRHRPQVDLSAVATGEHWFAERAQKLKLVDELITSDDFLFAACDSQKVYQIKAISKQSVAKKLIAGARSFLSGIVTKF